MNRKLILLALCFLIANLVMCKNEGDSQPNEIIQESVEKEQPVTPSEWSFEPVAQTDNLRVEISEGTYNIYVPEKGGTLNTLNVFDRKSNELIANAILPGDYGKRSLFYKQKMELPRLDDKQHLILLQSMFGGDGNHTANTLIAYSLINNRLEFLGAQNIYNTTLTEKNGIFNTLEGKAVLTFCDVCDGLDAALPEDLIYIPISVTFDTSSLKVRCTLSEEEKRELAQKFEERKQANIKEQEKYDSKYSNYKDFADGIAKEFYKLIDLSSN